MLSVNNMKKREWYAQKGYLQQLLPIISTITLPQTTHRDLSSYWTFDTGKHFRYVAINNIVDSLSPEKSTALPAFHAFTGCDQVLPFEGKGKISTWETWNAGIYCSK